MNDFIMAQNNEFDIKGLKLKDENGSLSNIKDNNATSIAKIPKDKEKSVYMIYFNNNSKYIYNKNNLIIDDEVNILINGENMIINKEKINHIDIEKDNKSNRYCITIIYLK